MWATWANLGPRQGQNCAQIGPTSANNNNTTTTTTTTPARADGSAFAGARLSGVSLINPAPAPRPCPRRRPSVVTEGYIRLPPLPPTGSARFRFTVARFRFTIIVVIYSVFCAWCSKNIVFYRVLWPSPSPGFISATLKNHGFFRGLGLRKGSGTENWTS